MQFGAVHEQPQEEDDDRESYVPKRKGNNSFLSSSRVDNLNRSNLGFPVFGAPAFGIESDDRAQTNDIQQAVAVD